MPSPKDYLKTPREAELAERVWLIAGTLPDTTRYGEVHVSHQLFMSLPWTTQRIILARDWITKYREQDGRGGVVAVNRELRGTDYTAEEIGNVEHFYVSAVLGTIGGPGAGPFLATFGNMVWEFVVGPARIGWSKRNNTWKEIWDAIARSYAHNAKQFAGPDHQGMQFGSMFSLTDAVERFTREYPDQDVLPVYTIKSGDWLSKIAERRYKDPLLWPLLYETNRKTIGPDPNKLTPGQMISIPELKSFTPAQIDEARMRGKNWRNYR